MKLGKITVVLPADDMDDMSPGKSAEEAGQLLSAWSAMWHPAILHAVRGTPRWAGLQTTPLDVAGHLVAIPECSGHLLGDGWQSQAAEAGAGLIGGLNSREATLAAAFERLQCGSQTVDADLAADFMALGLAHFVVDLLTRRLRYMSYLDEEALESEILLAADEAVTANVEAARERLKAAFDLLHESREYFFPVEAYMLDLTLAVPSTLGQSLRDELTNRVPTNLLVSAETIQRMALEEPRTLALLNNALEQGTAAVVGGEYDELALPLLQVEAIAAQFRRGRETYRKHLSAPPLVFGRRRFGLTPVLPQILDMLGFVGAMHFTLDDGRFPTENQSRIEWEGFGGRVIEALGRVPVDIGSADALSRLPELLGNSMDMDNVATVVFAHWPGTASPWYDDLQRISAYSPVLGTFVSVTEYFEKTAMSGQRTRYDADDYRSPYLREAVDRGLSDPISRWVRYYRRRALAESINTLDVSAALIGSAPCSRADPEDFFSRIDHRLDAAVDCDNDELDKQLSDAAREAVERFGKSLGVANSGVANSGIGDSSSPKGYLLVNPCSFPRRLSVSTPELTRPADVCGPVRAADESLTVVDVPAMGFAWVGPGSGAPPQPEQKRKRRWTRQSEPPLAEDNVLRNEFFEITIDRHTGALRSIADFRSRGARLAQQIALRTPQAAASDPGDDSHYSIMVADELTVTSAGPLLGEIVCRGRLVDREARRLAGFTQTTRAWRGSRIIELEIGLDIELVTGQRPQPNPWGSYYAARFAWNDATADVFRSVHQAVRPTEAVQIEAPHFIDIRSQRTRTTLLTGGLPYHRRFGLRKLDTLLVVAGERARKFRLGIGIDVDPPIAAGIDFLSPRLMQVSAAPPAPYGWLFHLDCPGVVATHWEAITTEGSTEGNIDGHIEGFRVRLLETEGRRTKLGLRSFRQIGTARRTDSDDELPIDGDKVSVELDSNAWIELEARFGKP